MGFVSIPVAWLHNRLFSFIYLHFRCSSAIGSAEYKKDKKPWETPVVILLVVFSLTGMIFLLLNLRDGLIKEIWQPISIALLATQFFLRWRGEKWLLKYYLKPGQLNKFYLVNIVAGLIVLPSSVLNIYYAFR